MSLPSASLLENARFNALIAVPHAVQGVFRRRRRAVAVATRANVDGHGIALMRGIRRSHSGGPVWVRLGRDPALLLLTAADVHRALAGSPAPFAPDPAGKRDGMCVFQPDALTISRGDLWRNRREFAEAVLDTARPRHRLAERFAGVVREEVGAAMGLARDELDYDAWDAAHLRISRRVVLGDAARDDEALSDLLAELMMEANGMPGETPDTYAELRDGIAGYADAAEEGSLVSLFADAPSDEQTEVPGQAVHWLMAASGTQAANTFRCLAMLAVHPRQREATLEEIRGGDADRPYLEGCIQDTMRLWPTTNMIARETIAETDWRGTTVPAGTTVVLWNAFLHRDPDQHPWADRFSPERWSEGEANSDPAFNHFSQGPQVCPGAGLALFLAKEAIATVLEGATPELRSHEIDPAEPLPHMLDFFAIRIGLAG